MIEFSMHNPNLETVLVLSGIILNKNNLIGLSPHYPIFNENCFTLNFPTLNNYDWFRPALSYNMKP